MNLLNSIKDTLSASIDTVPAELNAAGKRLRDELHINLLTQVEYDLVYLKLCDELNNKLVTQLYTYLFCELIIFN